MENLKRLFISFKKLVFSMLFCLNIVGAAGQSSASQNVSTFEIEAPQLETTKKIWIYLPAGYKNSGKKYPVLYLHDAQNVFDSTTAFSSEWRVDEFLDQKPAPGVIVVAIEHGNEKRIAELTPFPNEKYGGGEGAVYIDFIRNTLKPHIDKTYPTLSRAENTTIMGSSLGGLISFFAVLKYPETFGNAIVFSPSFWFSDKIFEFAENSDLQPGTRLYFLAGSSEGEEMIPDLLKMQGLLQKRSFPQENMKLKIVEGGEHNEKFWSSEFPEAYQWLLEKMEKQ